MCFNAHVNGTGGEVHSTESFPGGVIRSNKYAPLADLGKQKGNMAHEDKLVLA